MPHQTEPSANDAMAALLRLMLHGYRVRSETTQTIRDHPGQRPDILITADDRSLVVVEAEYLPALTVEQDANSRLGMAVTVDPRPIEAVIALRYPEAVRDSEDLTQAIEDAHLSFAVLHEDGTRFPESGWLDGSKSDLADLVRLVSVPQRAVNGAAALEQGIETAAAILNQIEQTNPGINVAISRLLGMSNVPQTRRMACAIIANALVFHERIAGMHQTIKPLRLVCGPEIADPQEQTLAAWSDILKINYWAIFGIAKDILEQLPSSYAAQVLEELRLTAQKVGATGVNNAHDLTRRIFQRLISDRKYLATFYTLPASAALLARLAVAKMDGIDWSDKEAIGNLRIADFACGTGALLSAVYEQVAARYEDTGGNPSELHPVMMEEVLYGCDVMPSAIHITGSTLSGVEPGIGFGSSRLYTLAYGRQMDGSVKIGSLELLQSSAALTLFNSSDPAMRTGSVGEQTSAQIMADIPDQGFDLVIMNPPFTSDTKHRDSDDGVLNAAFAAFGASNADQSDMATRLKQLANNTAYHGHAGLGSAFGALADKKVRPGGIIALVLPVTAVNGASWAKVRGLMAREYADITIVSIAANGLEMSFSSDTAIGECLIIGRKTTQNEKPNGRGTFVSLRRRPTGFEQSLSLSQAISPVATIRRLEDGPFGGLAIYSGVDIAGEVLEAPTHDADSGWRTARIRDYSSVQVAHSLSTGRLWLPAEPKARQIPITRLDQIGQRGLDSQMFISATHNGPFTKTPASPTATYPALWNHDAKNETRINCLPDSQLRVKPGMESRSPAVWHTASRAHISRGFRFNSQPLAIAFTEQPSAGGRAWPNITFDLPDYDYPFTLWGNSTLGLVGYWWHSNLQVAGRGDITINSAGSLPTLDFRELSGQQLAIAEEIFEEFRDKELKPAYLADADPNRALLDRRLVCELLGFGEEVYRGVRRLAAKWCAEPSVHGGKARPKDASLVI